MTETALGLTFPGASPRGAPAAGSVSPRTKPEGSTVALHSTIGDLLAGALKCTQPGPSPVGPNPSLTIAAFANRFADRM